MIDAGIYNGDRVIVAKADTARNGEIVVALVDDSATVKTFYKEKGRFRLQPQNASMDPIILDEVQILGQGNRIVPVNVTASPHCAAAAYNRKRSIKRRQKLFCLLSLNTPLYNFSLVCLLRFISIFISNFGLFA